LLGDRPRAVYLDAEVSQGSFDFRIAEQQLYRSNQTLPGRSPLLADATAQLQNSTAAWDGLAALPHAAGKKAASLSLSRLLSGPLIG
jgi:hypothetical protein